MGDLPRLLQVETSFAALPEAGAIRRLPRAPRRPRAQTFWRAFEDRVLWYDTFWDAEEQDILLVGPAARNLRPGLDAAAFTAQPSGTPLKAEFFTSRSATIGRLSGAPAGTTALSVAAFGETFALPVQPNFSRGLAGRRVLFSINKDNRLDWIADWARWHAVLHGTDTVILFDNGSTQYPIAAIEQTLAAIPQLRHIAVIPMPHRFGRADGAVLMTPHYANFLQISTMSIVLRRFGMAAQGLLNCDIDELAWAGGQSLYDRVRHNPLGVVRMRGRWIEAARAPDAPARHASFSLRRRDWRYRLSPSKWVLDPNRDWVQNLAVHPNWHRIHGAPPAARRHDSGAIFFHFKGINTDWKQQRSASAPDAEGLVRDEQLALALAAFQSGVGGTFS